MIARFFLLILLSLGILFPCAAQQYPAKPIKIVVPFPVGGIADLYSRLIGNRWTEAWGQPVVVENRTGAGGAIAMAYTAKAVPDGHTLVMGGSAPTVIIPALNPNATYSPKDFEPIGYVAALPLMMVAHPSVPAANIR